MVSAVIRYSGGYEYYDSTNNDADIGMLDFNSSIFFFALLPPILFNSGFHLKRNLFYSNLGGILGLALLGTIISSLVVIVGLYFLGKNNYLSVTLTLQEIIAFAALISSTDPVSTLSSFAHLNVDPTLFYLVNVNLV